MTAEYSIMFTIGIFCIFVPRQITSVLARLEWFFWSKILNEKEEKFKAYFQNRNPLYIRFLGIVSVFGSLIGLMLK